MEVRQPDPGALESLRSLIAPLLHPLATTGIILIFVSAVSALAQFQLNASQQAWVEETLAKMSVDEKIGQLMFPVATSSHGSLRR